MEHLESSHEGKSKRALVNQFIDLTGSVDERIGDKSIPYSTRQAIPIKDNYIHDGTNSLKRRAIQHFKEPAKKSKLNEDFQVKSDELKEDFKVKSDESILAGLFHLSSFILNSSDCNSSFASLLHEGIKDIQIMQVKLQQKSNANVALFDIVVDLLQKAKIPIDYRNCETILTSTGYSNLSFNSGLSLHDRMKLADESFELLERFNRELFIFDCSMLDLPRRCLEAVEIIFERESLCFEISQEANRIKGLAIQALQKLSPQSSLNQYADLSLSASSVSTKFPWKPFSAQEQELFSTLKGFTDHDLQIARMISKGTISFNKEQSMSLLLQAKQSIEQQQEFIFQSLYVKYGSGKSARMISMLRRYKERNDKRALVIEKAFAHVVAKNKV